MTSNLEQTSAPYLSKLADFQYQVMGRHDRFRTKSLSPSDIPEIGLSWAKYIFRTTWHGGLVSVAAISFDAEYMALYVFCDATYPQHFNPLGIHDFEPTSFELPEPSEKLVENMVLRLAQLGMDSTMIGATTIGRYEDDLPINLGWSEMCVRTFFEEEGGTAAILATDATGTKTLVYVDSIEPLRLSEQFAESPEKRFPEDNPVNTFHLDDDDEEIFQIQVKVMA